MITDDDIRVKHRESPMKPSHRQFYDPGMQHDLPTPPVQQTNGGMKWNDFLNPRSMLTPGVAGSVVMVITNTLWVEFMLPQKWTALTLSFLLIIPILVKFSASILENIIYFTFNGLIVFSLAVNTNFAGRKLQEIGASDRITVVQRTLKTSLSFSNPSPNEPINTIQLASNHGQGTLLLTEQRQGQTDRGKDQNKNKQDDKREKTQDKSKKQNRAFFGKWF